VFTINVVDNSNFAYEEKDSEKFKTMGTFETRGAELIEWIPSKDEEEFKAADGRFNFSLEDEYYDVDDDGNEVSVTEIQHQISKA
jgi:hypothetical protein